MHVSFFAQGQIINIFNNSKVNNLVSGQFDTTIRTSRTNATASSGLAAVQPVHRYAGRVPAERERGHCKAMGANWQKGPLFGQGLSKDAYQTPRTYRLAFGARF